MSKRLPKAQKKAYKTLDPNWETRTYSGSGRSPFNIEWLKYFNPVEGRDQILFLYTDKKTKKIVKWRALR